MLTKVKGIQNNWQRTQMLALEPTAAAGSVACPTTSSNGSIFFFFFWNFLRKLKMELPFDLAIPLLGLYPKNPNHQPRRSYYPDLIPSFKIYFCWKKVGLLERLNGWLVKKVSTKPWVIFRASYREHYQGLEGVRVGGVSHHLEEEPPAHYVKSEYK